MTIPPYRPYLSDRRLVEYEIIIVFDYSVGVTAVDYIIPNYKYLSHFVAASRNSTV